MHTWRPTATIDNLRARAGLYRYIHQFFAERGFLEVDPPVLGRGGSTDPHLHSWQTSVSISDAAAESFYLQTSPEFFMKRLLAAGSGPIYALTKAFRRGESGRYHNPEFAMLEWYQPGFDDHQLMQQVAELIGGLLPVATQTFSYREVFQSCLAIDPHAATEEELVACAEKHFSPSWKEANRDVWLDALFSHVIQPQLPKQLVFICDYPASQAALAKVLPDETGTKVGRRFEAFVNGVELVNGYWELTDAEEQEQRFERDNQMRQAMNLPAVVMDRNLLRALQAGLPDVAGVALGVDRLLMILQGANSIAEVIDFPFDRV